MTKTRFILIFCLICCFCGLTLKAQQEFTLTGAIFEKGTKLRVVLAEINNKRNKYSVGSNDMGLFEIKVAVGDTLVINKRGFNDLTVVVPTTKDIVVNLVRAENMLNEVVVYGETKKQALDAIKKDFKDKGSFYAGKPPFLSFLFTPLTALYELFGRTPKNARRFNNYYNTEIQQTHIDAFFNKSIINKRTGLEGKQLEDFMLNYRPDYERAKNWTEYDGNKWIKDSYKKYTDTLKTPIKQNNVQQH
jgi:hypothetical protein